MTIIKDQTHTQSLIFYKVQIVLIIKVIVLML